MIEIIPDILPLKCWSQETLDPTSITIHAISARNTNREDPYNYASIRKILVDYGFSAHFGGMRNGKIIRWVPEDKIAFHAGRSRFRDESGLNDSSIGIEIFGMDDTPFEDIQYHSAAQLVAELMQRYNMKSDVCRMHSEVSSHLVRKDPKWDPGLYFDWVYFGYLVMTYRMKLAA